MTPEDYQAFTAALRRNLERDSRVIALITAGSTAGRSHQPDEWSDHDFWVVVEQNAQDWFATHREWVPDPDQIVLFFRDPVHDGFTVIYRIGHLLEFAVSDRQGLNRAKVNDYRLLIDRDRLAEHLARMHQDTIAEFDTIIRDDLRLFGQFLVNLLIRYRTLPAWRAIKRSSVDYSVCAAPVVAIDPQTHSPGAP